jgi:ribonuclease HI
MSGTWTLHFDGLCEPKNPGGVIAYGFVIDFGDGQKRQGQGSVPAKPENTNNAGEYFALGCGLRVAEEVVKLRGRPDTLIIKGDSKLVIEQLLGRWSCNVERLDTCRRRCLEILRGIDVANWWTASWVPREENERADALSRAAYKQLTGREAPEWGKAARR